MTISKDLFLATLSLDAYNQGYGERIEHGETVIGSAVFNQGDDSGEAQAAGFYAVAYDVGGSPVDGLTDTIVISYRGTDDFGLFSPTSDIWNGWVRPRVL